MATGTRNYGLITSIEELERFAKRLLDGTGPIGFDIETGFHGPDVEKGSLRVETNTLVGISFTDSLDWARYVPLGHDNADNLDNYAAARVFWVLLSTGRGVAHNLVFELRNLARWFREQLSDDPDFGDAVRASRGYFPGLACTQVESYLVSEHRSFGLKHLVEVMFGHKMTELHELFPGLAKNKRKFLRFNILDPTDPAVYTYACEDSLWCLAIHEHYHRQVQDRLLWRVDMGILPVIAAMADHGIRYDYALMARAAEELRDFQSRFNAEIMADLSEMTGEPVAINLASWRQVGDTLYHKLGMATTVYTKSTKDLPPDQRVMSTGAIALAGLAKQYPVVKKILQWKEMTKLLGSYLDKYEKTYGGSPGGNIHPNLSSALVVTGRFACADPNYQASPKKYHFDLEPARAAHRAHEAAHGKKCECDDAEFTPPAGSCWTFNFRDAVIAPPGHYILGFDLSQAELRAIAGEAQEQALLDAFAKGQDVHTLTAALMLRIPIDEVTPEQRGTGKTLNFALLYGMGAKSLADRLAISKEEAQELFEMYFAAYPAIAVWSAKQVRFGKKNLYVTSKFGRRLPIWEFASDKRWIYEKGERACVNYPIQGCLPRDTHVLTRRGWCPIGEFADGTEVWTGAEWSPAIRLAMGTAPRVRLHLSDGRTFDCDDRHRLLVKGEPWPEWKLVTEAKGLPLCQDQNTDWGQPDDSTVEDWYWVGRFVGDGSLFSTKGYWRWALAFDGVKEKNEIERFRDWLDSKPWTTARSKKGYVFDDSRLRNGSGKGVKIQGQTPAAIAFWLAHGIQLGVGAKSLRVPPVVFTLDRLRREAFCEGYLGSDGSARYDGRETYWSKLTSASRSGLEDMLRLFQTIGRTGRIGKPVVLKGRGAGGTDYVFYDLWLHRAPAALTIVDIEYLPEEPMYTLSVDHPRHAFSSEGLISKNSATGDYLRIAMIRADKAITGAGLRDRVHMVMNVHDALEFYVHESVMPDALIKILDPAVIFPVAGWPAMAAEWHIARKWGSPVEVTLDASGRLLSKEKTTEIVPVIEEDEETGEDEVVLPEEDVAAVQQVLARRRAERSSPQVRTVIVALSDMPTVENWGRFRDLVNEIPGPHTVTVRTPQGDLELGPSGLDPQTHLARVSLLLGAVQMHYDASTVDARDLLKGLAL